MQWSWHLFSLALSPWWPWKRNSFSFLLKKNTIFSITLSVFRIFWKMDAWKRLTHIPNEEPSFLDTEWLMSVSVAHSWGVTKTHFQDMQTFEPDPLILFFPPSMSFYSLGDVKGSWFSALIVIIWCLYLQRHWPVNCESKTEERKWGGPWGSHVDE